MKLLQKSKNIEWLPQPNEIHLIASKTLPPLDLCTSAYVFAFDGDKLRMANLNRGVDTFRAGILTPESIRKMPYAVS